MRKTRHLGSILIADDDRFTLEVLAHHLTRHFIVRQAGDGTTALAALEEQRPVAVIVDQLMPGATGVEVLARARERCPEAVRILMTASDDVGHLVDAVNRGAIHRFFRKPLRGPELAQAVVDAVQRAREEQLLRVELESLARLRTSGDERAVAVLASDEEELSGALCQACERAGLVVRRVPTAGAPAALMELAPDLICFVNAGDVERLAHMARASDDAAALFLVDAAPSLLASMRAHELGADYLGAPLPDAAALEVRVARALAARRGRRDLRRLTRDLIVANKELAWQRQRTEEEQVQVLNAMIRALEAKDPYTAGHTDRVAAISVRIGYELNLDVDSLERIRVGALLHDIGKIGVRDAVLLKPDRLTGEEFEYIKQHTTLGDELLSGIEQFRCVAPVIRHHHEKLDGSGYPDGLRGAEIPIEVRVVSVADVLDALTSTRPYRDATSADVAFEVMKSMEGHHLDPELVRVARKISDAGRLDDLLQFHEHRARV